METLDAILAEFGSVPYGFRHVGNEVNTSDAFDIPPVEWRYAIFDRFLRLAGTRFTMRDVVAMFDQVAISYDPDLVHLAVLDWLTYAQTLGLVRVLRSGSSVYGFMPCGAGATGNDYLPRLRFGPRFEHMTTGDTLGPRSRTVLVVDGTNGRRWVPQEAFTAT